MQRKLHWHRKGLGLEAAENSCSWDSAPCYDKNEVFKLVTFRVFQYYSLKNILCAYHYRNIWYGKTDKRTTAKINVKAELNFNPTKRNN